MFHSPGNADDLSPELLDIWNSAIQNSFDELSALHSRFFSLDPGDLINPQSTGAVKWAADPAEPAFCVDDTVAQQLSDWPVVGRHQVQNEYCEYAVQFRPDEATGTLRPKRVEITTELRELWIEMAVHDPDRVLEMATECLGFEPSWQDLYGVAQPKTLSEGGRKLAFCRTVAGNGGDRSLIEAGVPREPMGALNRDHALFMTFPINGLDDLLYIVMFGAQPYAVQQDGEVVRATRDEIFLSDNVAQLACRHADPAAAMGAYAQAFQGKQVAFTDPLGMYLRPISEDIFTFGGEPVPAEWITYSRGDENTRQRLVFGPPDDVPDVFLDDLTVSTGAADEPITGGYQIVRNLEVGPLVSVGNGAPVADDEWRFVARQDDPIVCGAASICSVIARLKEEFDAQHPNRVAPRRMSVR